MDTMIGMKFKNTTKIPNEQLRQIIRFVKPSGLTKFSIWIKNSNYGFAGRAYSSMMYATIRIPKKNQYPYLRDVDSDRRNIVIGRATRGYLPSLILSKEEGIVNIIAHELRHLWQATHKRGRIWGSRGKYSERDADAYAIRMMRKWRKQQPIPLIKIQVGNKA